MLFIKTNMLPHALNESERLRLLDILTAAGGMTPLIRSARNRFFQLLAGQTENTAAAAELERECVSRHESQGDAAYAPGELFCMDDCILALVFTESTENGVSASVVYSLDTAGPLAKLERLCMDVRGALIEMRKEARDETTHEQTPELPIWQQRAGSSPQGLARFIASQPTDFVRAAAVFRAGHELKRASELMEERVVRLFLRRVQEMRREGYTPRRLLKEAGVFGGVSLEQMLEAGLLEREVRVSCRKSGHALFDLPSPDSLAAMTISRAKCSQCAAPVADEVIEETINPTRLAVSLLEDGRWLSNRVIQIIRQLGVPDIDIATGQVSEHGESHMIVEVGGSSFLFVTRDGDLTPAFCRRAAEVVEETETTHLVVVITGASEDEGILRLNEFAWRRARDGHDLGTTLIEGLSNAQTQIRRSFESAVHRELSHKLFTLDAALGFSATDFVLGWFKLARASGTAKAGADRRAQIGVSRAG